MSGMVPPVALVGAMKVEVDGLRKQMSVERSVALRGWSLHQGRLAGRELLLLQTGPGRRQVEEALEYLLPRHPVGGIVSFGFAGALTEDLKAGDLVPCSLLHRGDDPGGDGCCSSDPRMLALAKRVLGADGSAVRLGTVVTVDRLVRSREERAALRESCGATVVDMESCWVATQALAWGIPFLAVRAVSDTPADALPPLDRLLGPDGRWLWSRASAHFLAHPGDLAKMPGVYLNSRRAASNLTRLLGALIPEL